MKAMWPVLRYLSFEDIHRVFFEKIYQTSFLDLIGPLIQSVFGVGNETLRAGFIFFLRENRKSERKSKHHSWMNMRIILFIGVEKANSNKIKTCRAKSEQKGKQGESGEGKRRTEIPEKQKAISAYVPEADSSPEFPPLTPKTPPLFFSSLQ